MPNIDKHWQYYSIDTENLMNISLPEKLKRKIMEVVEQGNFSTPGDYMRQLVRKDLEKKQAEDLHLKELSLIHI